MAEEDTALIGAKLGPYRIEKLLGAGAMGEVFLAVHEALGRPVAIKTLKPQVAADRSLTERFFAEARAVNIIRHENIVECTDLVNDPGGKSYIVMELLEGSTLGVAIRRARKVPPRRAARIAAQIADAIGAAHGKGIVHRDLKPDNVFLIKRAGSSDYVKVLDFGMARLRPELGGVGATQSGALIGTPAYMSPEQARGEKVGPSTDIYALGVVLYHMLTGELPFAATSLTMMLVAHLQQTPPRVDELSPDTPPALVALVARALAKDPADRPADMAAFRVALLEAVDLPIEHGSVIDSASPVASVALEPTLSSDESPLASATAPRATPPPSISSPHRSAVLRDPAKPDLSIGQSSVSGAASELLPTPQPAKRRWPWLAGGAFAIAAGTIAIVATTHGGSAQPPTPAVAPAPAAPAPAPAPAPPPPRVDLPPAPDIAATPDAGVPDKTIAHKPAPRVVAKKPTPKTEPPKPDAGSTAPVTEPAHTDRTKTLVGPKPPPS